MIREPALAKINLFLEVVGRMSNGYHHLQSVMVFGDVGEWVGCEKTAMPQFIISGPQASGLDPKASGNLVLKARDAFQEAARSDQSYGLKLHKAMPVSSGIGGGSADAAATLRALNRLHDDLFSTQQLLDIAKDLGSDVPACLVSKPIALNGSSAELTETTVNGCRHGVLVNPGSAVSTPAVFKALAASDLDLVPAMPSGPWDVPALRIKRNDLRSSAISLCPDIQAVLSCLAALPGATFAQMSGSGATCFAVFRTAESAQAAALQITREYPAWWCTAVTLTG